jgi:hypothetical protein
MAGIRVSSRELYKILCILLLASKLLLSLFSFVVDNMQIFKETQIYILQVQDTHKPLCAKQ